VRAKTFWLPDQNFQGIPASRGFFFNFLMQAEFFMIGSRTSGDRFGISALTIGVLLAVSGRAFFHFPVM